MKQLTPLGRLLSTCLLTVALLSCSALTRKPEPPRVTLVGLKLVSVELLEQRYQISLRVKNPNTFELPIRGIDFQLELNGRNFADGVGSQSIDVPAFGENVIELEVSSNLLQVFQQLQSLDESRAPAFEYRISGTMATRGYGQKLPFDYSGELKLPRADRSNWQRGL